MEGWNQPHFGAESGDVGQKMEIAGQKVGNWGQKWGFGDRGQGCWMQRDFGGRKWGFGDQDMDSTLILGQKVGIWRWRDGIIAILGQKVGIWGAEGGDLEMKAWHPPQFGAEGGDLGAKNGDIGGRKWGFGDGGMESPGFGG